MLQRKILTFLVIFTLLPSFEATDSLESSGDYEDAVDEVDECQDGDCRDALDDYMQDKMTKTVLEVLCSKLISKFNMLCVILSNRSYHESRVNSKPNFNSRLTISIQKSLHNLMISPIQFR